MTTLAEILALAHAHTAANRMADAEQLFREAIGLDAACAPAHHDLGVTLAHQGRINEAVASLEEAYRLAPQSQAIAETLRLARAIASNLRGSELAEQGHWEAAAHCQQTAIELNPNFAQAHCDLGLVRLKENRLDDAAAALLRACELEPQRADAYNHLGVVRARQQKLDQAIAMHERALELAPDYAEAYYNLGVALAACGRWQDAVIRYRRAIHLNAKLAQAHNNLGIALGHLGQLDAACECYQRAIAADPEFAEAHNNLGVALAHRGQLRAAESAYCRAVALKPSYAEARHNLGTCLIVQGRYADAAVELQRASELRPDYPESPYNLSHALLANNAVEASLVASERAIELRPDYADAHFNRAAALLTLGRMEDGWREYEWRLKQPRNRRADLPESSWTGEPLDGRTILIASEQGAGDTIQFLRYLPLVCERGGRVIVECPANLKRLVERLPYASQVVTAGEPLPAFDTHVRIASLPGIFQTTLENLPAGVPYLEPDPTAVAHWREELAALPGLKVGIAWQGNPDNLHDRDRSFPLDTLLKLADIDGVQLVSMQFGAGREQLQTAEGAEKILDLGERLGDYLDTAAIVKNLDLVIVCDSSLAHLAGALAVPAWVALPWAADWRWMIARSDSPWYPTMRLFRQAQAGDWREVFDRVREALVERVATDDKSDRKLSAVETPVEAKATDVVETGPPETLQAIEQPAEESVTTPLASPTSAESPPAVPAEHLQRVRAGEVTELALQLAGEGHADEAAVHFRRAIEIDPDHTAAHGNLGNVLLQQGDLAGAAECYRRVLALDPRSVEAHYSLGVVANEEARFTEAERWCRRAIELRADYGDAHYVLATALLRQNRLAEAESAFRRAVELKPDFVGSHLGRAFSLLAAGKTAEGWREYEWRSKNQPVPDGADKLPRWQGEPLRGKTLLVRCEQGFGDTLQFIRFAPVLESLGARVVVQCRPPLARLIERCEGVALVSVVGEPLPAADLQIPLLSVPGVLGVTFDNIPAKVPYLATSPDAAARWHRELDSPRRLRAGIAWQGDATQPMDRFRSFALAHFTRLARLDGLRLFSLQFGAGQDQLATFEARDCVIDLGDRLGDFHDTAAIVKNLDLVITCDSAVAHLAGGLGVPVWVALAHTCDWRWMLDRTDSPWYPTMRLFRQPKLGDWANVFQRIERELSTLARTPRRGKSNIDRPAFLD